MKALRLLVLLGFMAASVARAVGPGTLSYQGQLFLDGQPAVGPVSVTFRMFDAASGGIELWAETDVVTVTAGLFQTVLGDGTAFPATLFTNQVPWLEMEVGGSVLSPRNQFQSVPYALNAPTTGGSGQWSSDGTDVWRAAGRVGIGLASPTSVLDIISTTGDHNINAVRYTAINPALRLNSTAEGNHQSAVQFLDSGIHRWSLLNDVYGDDSQNFGVRDIASGLAPFTIDAAGGVNIGSGYANPNSNLRGSAEVSEVGVGPDTYNYAMLGVTRSSAAGNQSYLGLTKSAFVPWGIGIGSSDNLIFGTAAPGRTIPAPRLSIAPFSGHVGIGTSSPGGRLDVHSDGSSFGIRHHVAAGPELGSYVTLGSNNSRGALRLGNPAPWGVESADDAALFQTTGGWQWNKQLNIMGAVGINTNAPSATLTVNGSFTATGTKCRVVEDTEYGDLYFHATESSRPLFTTEGEGFLVDGKSTVELDPKWLAGVTIDDSHPMHVWITFYGPHGDYWVERGPRGFTIVERSGASSPFGWKVEARQRGYENAYLDRPEPVASGLRRTP